MCKLISGQMFLPDKQFAASLAGIFKLEIASWRLGATRNDMLAKVKARRFAAVELPAKDWAE